MWTYNTNYLSHHGVKGQKWGDRNYQYEDGSLTPEGRVHYGYGKGHIKERLKEKAKKASNFIKNPDEKEKDVRRNALIAAGIGAGIGTVMATAVVAKYAGKMPVKNLVKPVVVNAGKMAAISSIALYGSSKAGDFIKESKNKKASSSAGFVGNAPSPKESIRKSQSIGTINAPTVSESLRQHRKYNI